ncbi:predicted protein [Histoplasma capsulatum var. duboisii H88]|uniref:Predicted protein n=2 Tax=Ajellomyces capsulatus (strain H88) TaxID=544711 RepID=F0U7R6_AJEC8|nr:predicted protein [Histoplasma capsulatum var. duboisii H88]
MSYKSDYKSSVKKFCFRKLYIHHNNGQFNWYNFNGIPRRYFLSVLSTPSRQQQQQASKQASKKRDPPNGLKRNPSTKDMGYIYLREALPTNPLAIGDLPVAEAELSGAFAAVVDAVGGGTVIVTSFVERNTVSPDEGSVETVGALVVRVASSPLLLLLFPEDAVVSGKNGTVGSGV